MIEKELHRHDFVPGTERYTKPEEIGALNKFLRSVKKTQEEHTKLEEDDLALPGTKLKAADGLILPEIDALDNTRLDIIDLPEDPSLETKKLPVDSKENIPTTENLVDYRENIEAPPKVTELPPETPNYTMPDSSMGTVSGDPVKGLESYRENIEKPTDLPLEDYREDINKPNDRPLEDTRLGILKPHDLPLEDYRENIQKPKDLSLEDTKEIISQGKEVELETTKEIITPAKDLNLETGKEILTHNPDIPLETTRSELHGKQDIGLEQDRIDISRAKDVELENRSRKLHGQKDIGLETEKISLSRGEDTALDESRVKLNGPTKEPDLDNTRVDLKKQQKEPVLETEATKGPEPKKVELSDTLVRGQLKETPALDTTLIGGPVPKNDPELETDKAKLDKAPDVPLNSTVLRGPIPVEPVSLEDMMVGLYDSQDLSLDTTRIDIEEIDETPLDDTRIGLWDNTEDLELETESIQRPESLNLNPDTPDSLPEDYIKRPDSIIQDTPESLVDTRIDIKPKEDIGLEDEVIYRPSNSEKTNENPDLEDEVIYRPENSEKTREEIENLEDYIETIKPKEDLELEDEVIHRPDNSEKTNENPGLEDYIETIKPKEDIGLEDEVISRPENSEKTNESPGLEDELIYRPSNSEKTNENPGLEDYKEYIEPKENLELGDKVIHRPENSKDRIISTTLDPDNLDALIIPGKETIPSIKTPVNAPLGDRTIDSVRYEIKDAEEEVKRPDSVELDEETGRNKIPNFKTYGDIDARDKYHTPGRADHGYLVPEYKLPEFRWSDLWDGSTFSPSKYLRYAAENTVGKLPVRGAWKSKLIDATLAGLVLAREIAEKSSKSAKHRLPGDDMGLLSKAVGGTLNGKNLLKSVASSIGGALGNSVDNKNPINRPQEDGKNPEVWIAPGQEILDNDGFTVDGGSPKNFWKKVGESLMGSTDRTGSSTRSFDDYTRGIALPDQGGVEGYYTGMGATLQDLLGKQGGSSSLEDFREALRKSPWITTPDKFTSTKNTTNYYSLDSNHIWEITFTPYLGALNGYRTWLPSLLEIDKLNKASFNYTTHFGNGWLPITGFELQEKKLTSKDLPLYDGSISYPIGMEFTNEIRITFADDSLKSLKRYFDLCSKVSVYMSNIHVAGEEGYHTAFEGEGESKYWNSKTSDMPYAAAKRKGLSTTGIFNNPTTGKPVLRNNATEWNPTVYLDGKIHPGLYKNLSFLVTVYIFTPQYGLIKRCNLLCVIKDYMIENQGEIDASPTELSVTFSIVGENPPDGSELARAAYGASNYEPPKKTGNTDRTGTGILDNLDSIVDLI